MIIILSDDGKEKFVAETNENRIIFSEETKTLKEDWYRYQDTGISLTKEQLRVLFYNDDFKKWIEEDA